MLSPKARAAPRKWMLGNQALGLLTVVRNQALFHYVLGDEVRLKERRAATESLDAWLLLQRAERVRKEAQARRGTPAAADSSYARADSLLQLSSAADARWPEPVTLQAQVAYERAFLQRDRSRQTTWLRSAAQYATQALGLRPDGVGILRDSV